jgi:hypothetical protein
MLRNTDAELAVLGAVLVDERAAARVIPLLQPEHFWSKERARAYELIVAHRAAGLPADAVALAPTFDSDETLIQAGGRKYLGQLFECATTPINAVEYAHLMLDLHRRCELIDVADDMMARACDLAATDLDGVRITELAQMALAGLNGITPCEDWSDCVRSTDACGCEYPEPEHFVQGFLTVGLTVVSATPKAGKTWLVHECALGIATGSNALGVLPCQRSDVLCGFFEDSERRGILRERKLLGHASGCAGITYAWVGSKWNLDRVARWLDSHPACRVVIIDTAERYKQMQGDQESSGRIYADDYRFWGALQAFAIGRSIALIVIHHDRKPNGSSGNVLDTVSGTRAITGAADHVWLLEHNGETGVSTLKVIGRDLDETSVQFSRGDDGRLRAVEVPVLDTVARIEQRARARHLRDEGVTFRDIAKALGVTKSTVERWCQNADGQ